MATETNTAAGLDKIASLLDLEPDEFAALLHQEFKAITADISEFGRYPERFDQFVEFAVERISDIAATQKYLPVLQKIVHRNEARKFYFFENELEAISRILYVIEIPDHYQVSLNNLNLHALPPLLRRTRNLQKLNISNNRLRSISMVADLPDLQTLIANDNEITDVEFLQNNHKLKVVCLNNNRIKSTYEVIKTMPALRELELAGNKINDTLLETILENRGIEKINMENNPINAPLEMLNNINKLREYFRIMVASTDSFELKGGDATLKISKDISQQNLEEVASLSGAPATDSPKAEQFISYAIGDIRLRGNPPDKNLLDIEKLSRIFYNLIANSDSNGEHFFGLFGRWGRGKTYFWNYILKNNLDNKKYIPVEFHAWKYQDTPGIWAYLYNTLKDTYLGEHPRWYQPGKWYSYGKKLIRLNEQRGRLLPLVVFLISMAAAMAVYIYNDVFKGDKVVKIALGIGIPLWSVSMLTYIVKTFRADARKIISSLTTNVNFNNQLGFQHEIQQELKYLLKAWIPEKIKLRIFLFIDDIDRCSQEKIIQIVDYIRVLLHCEAIQDRITVLAAIDERILLHAIQNKYKAFIENMDNDATYKELCREYMDKLFLAGLKLGPLTFHEKEQIIDGFTSIDTATAEPVTEVTQNVMDSNMVSQDKNKSNAIGANKRQAAQERTIWDEIYKQLRVTAHPYGSKQQRPALQEEESDAIADAPIDSTADKKYLYEIWEQKFLKEILTRNTEFTPRSIRVYTYRYLLGKQLVENSLKKGSASYMQWYNAKEAKQWFAIKLLHYGFKSDTDHLLLDYRNFIADYNESRLVKECIYGYEISLNQELGSIMFQVLTMIIAY